MNFDQFLFSDAADIDDLPLLPMPRDDSMQIKVLLAVRYVNWAFDGGRNGDRIELFIFSKLVFR